MRHWLTSILVVAFLSKVTAQQIVNEFTVDKKYVLEGIELFAINDSIVFNVSLHNKGVGQQEIETLLALRNQKPIIEPNIRLINKKPICGILSLSAGIKRFYFIDTEKEKFRINALEVDFANRRTIGVEGEVALNGRFLKMEVKNDQVTVYAYDNNTLQETILNGFTIARQINYIIPFEIFKDKQRDISLIMDHDLIGSVQAKARVKVFISSEFITVTFDSYRGDLKSKSETRFVRFDRKSAAVSELVIKEPSGGNFSSAVIDTLLYRVTNMRKYFELQIFNTKTGNKIYSYGIDLADSLKKHLVYFREGRAKKISKTEWLKHMMGVSAACDPFIVVSKSKDSMTHVVTWGTYFDNNGFSAPGGATPLSFILPIVIGTTIRQLSEGPGISRYFYMAGNLSKGFAYSENSTLRSKIDSFEMTHPDQRNEGYFQAGDGVIAAYYNSKSRKVSFLKFSF
jgi:hypothetical protein